MKCWERDGRLLGQAEGTGDLERWSETSRWKSKWSGKKHFSTFQSDLKLFLPLLFWAGQGSSRVFNIQGI